MDDFKLELDLPREKRPAKKPVNPTAVFLKDREAYTRIHCDGHNDTRILRAAAYLVKKKLLSGGELRIPGLGKFYLTAPVLLVNAHPSDDDYHWTRSSTRKLVKFRPWEALRELVGPKVEWMRCGRRDTVYVETGETVLDGDDTEIRIHRCACCWVFSAVPDGIEHESPPQWPPYQGFLDWLRTERGYEWAQTSVGQEWLDTHPRHLRELREPQYFEHGGRRHKVDPGPWG